MKKITVAFMYLLAGWLGSCQSPSLQQQNNETDDTELPAPTLLKSAFAPDPKWEAILKAYLAVKDGFVQSDTGIVNRKALDLQNLVAKTESASLPAEAQSQWKNLQTMLDRTTTTLRAVPKLESKRAAFEDLSKLMYELVTTFGASETVYKQYCPMALNDKGAYWLSVNKEINNPYFGDKMLECGEVQEVLTFKKPE